MFFQCACRNSTTYPFKHPSSYSGTKLQFHFYATKLLMLIKICQKFIMSQLEGGM